MSHADKAQNNYELNNDSTSKLPSKSSQPPIAMAGNMLVDYDRRVYLAKKYRTQLASAPAALCSVLAGAPMENIKTRMQSKYFLNAWDCTKYTFRTEGVRGFWAGTTAPLFSLTFSRVVSFSVYQKAKYSIDLVMQKSLGHSPLATVNEPGTFPDVYTVGCFTTSGMIAGASMALLLSPFELLKNAAQTSVLMAAENAPRDGKTQRGVGKVGSYNAMKLIIERRGVLGLWTGFRLHLLRDTIGSGIYFGVYEAVKQSYTSYTQNPQANAAPAVATAGILCGIMSWVVTYPLDTMKTRAQNTLVGSDPSSSFSTSGSSATSTTLDKAAAAVSRASKWKGVEMIILRSSIQNMIQMCMFEGIKTEIIGLEFSDGRTDLPKHKREKGRDNKII